MLPPKLEAVGLSKTFGPYKIMARAHVPAIINWKREIEGLEEFMITHKFREVMGFCDEVTVPRQGHLTGSGLVKDLTPAAMAEMMMSKASIPAPAAREIKAVEVRHTARLVLDKVTATNEIGVEVLRGLALEVLPHEIVGSAGVSGNR